MSKKTRALALVLVVVMIVAMVASGHRPSGASKMDSAGSGNAGRPKNISTNMAWCPFSRRARQAPAPEARETPRSVERPPASTTIFISVPLFVDFSMISV